MTQKLVVKIHLGKPPRWALSLLPPNSWCSHGTWPVKGEGRLTLGGCRGGPFDWQCRLGVLSTLVAGVMRYLTCSDTQPGRSTRRGAAQSWGAAFMRTRNDPCAADSTEALRAVCYCGVTRLILTDGEYASCHSPRQAAEPGGPPDEARPGEDPERPAACGLPGVGRGRL